MLARVFAGHGSTCAGTGQVSGRLIQKVDYSERSTQ